jgi:hypothetical protein
MQVADFNQFGSVKPPEAGDSRHCAQCEAMLADALDGTLSPSEQADFDLHMASCAACSAMLADAQRGAAWLEMLKSPRPEPPSALLERILAQTCDQADLTAGKHKSAHAMWQPSTILSHPGAVGVPASRPAYASAYVSTKVLPFRARIASGFSLRSIGQTLLQPRLAMTAAMAFFSITLTLNLTGVRVSALRASDLSPSSLKRSLYEANAHVLRYYDNLKVVYELESRVRDLQRSSSDSPYQLPADQNDAPAAGQKQQPSGSSAPQQDNPADHKPEPKQSRPKPGPGSSRRDTPIGNLQLADAIERQASFPDLQSFAVFTPNVLKYLQEGDMV